MKSWRFLLRPGEDSTLGVPVSALLGDDRRDFFGVRPVLGVLLLRRRLVLRLRVGVGGRDSELESLTPLEL